MTGNNNNATMTLTPKCGAGIDHRRRIIKLEEDNEDQWKVINQLRNRPPVWATAIISLLTFLLGCSITYAALIIRVVKLKEV